MPDVFVGESLVESAAPIWFGGMGFEVELVM
jgi:hypothetical protein